MKITYLTVLAAVLTAKAHTQIWPFEKTDRQIIHKANLDYTNGKFDEAFKAYEKIRLNNPKNDAARFNIGSAAYKAKKYDDAIRYYQEAAESITDKALKSESYYNLGNAHLSKENYAEAIKAYKNALKLNPNDEDARYNLSYALQRQKSQQQPQQQPQDQPAPPDQMTKNDADNIMNDLDNQEKELRKNMNNKGREEDLQKDW